MEKNNKRLIAEMSYRPVILLLPIQSSPSGAGFYVCEVGKTWRLVLRKNIALAG